MKKVLYLSAIALTSLIATSCASEDMPSADGAHGLTTFTVQLPDDGIGTRFGEGVTAKKLFVAITEAGQQDVLFSNFTNDLKPNGMTVTDFSLSPATDKPTATVTVSLVKDKEYDIYFWAQSYGTTDGENCPYTWDAAKKTITIDYTDGTESSTSMKAYDEARDAFFAKRAGYKSTGAGDNIALSRPFAQVNVGTKDVTEFEKAGGTGGYGIKIAQVGNVLNLGTGKADETSELKDVTVATAEAKGNTTTGEEAFPYQPDTYRYLAMAYVLPGDDTSAKGNVTVSLNADNKAPFATYDQVPVQMNYRTNIYGALLTNPEVFNVEIAPAFAGTMDSAIIEMNNGTVNCVVPKLPAGVTAEQLKGKGGVYIDAQGQPQTFNADGHAIAAAMRESSEIYFAPNAIITTGSHWLVVPQSGVTIHGNGATLTGGEQDFSIQEGATYTQYEEGSTVNITIENLNGVKVWGGPTTNATFNINLNNCTMKGKGLTNKSPNNMVMVRPLDNATCKVNLNAENCYLEGMQVAFHTSVAGTEVYKNCTFKNVGVPINIAKKLNGALMSISVIGCTFDNCGIAHDDTANSAYNYAAPIRVVDNGGPENAINLLVDGCTFTGTLSQWDLLLMDYRTGTNWFPVNYTIRNCTPANPKVKATAN